MKCSCDSHHPNSCIPIRDGNLNRTWSHHCASYFTSIRAEQPHIIHKGTGLLNDSTGPYWICLPPLCKTTLLTGKIISGRCVWHIIRASTQQQATHPSFWCLGGKPDHLWTWCMALATKRTSLWVEYVCQMKESLVEAYGRVREKTQASQKRQKEFYDQRVHGEPHTPGDLVWLHSTVTPRGQCRKFHHPWIGPFKIVKQISQATYRIQGLHGKRVR